MTAAFSPVRLPLTVLIATRNEAVNLPKCLESLKLAERIIVLDSHSHDGTPEIAREFGCDVVQFDYQGGYPKKRQWALDTLDVTTEWILLLDADEVVPPVLWLEIAQAIKRPDAPQAFLVTKGFHFMGRKFRFGGFSHSAVLLFRKGHAVFEKVLDHDPSGQDMEVHERLVVDGKVGKLNTPLVHEDFKGLEAYVSRHNKYSTWEAQVRHQYLSQGRYGHKTIQPRLFGNAQERRRFLKQIAVRLPFESWLWFFYHYFLKLGFLEGRPGLIASQIRASYISQVRAKVFELTLNGPENFTLANDSSRGSCGKTKIENSSSTMPSDRHVVPETVNG